jgi:hypothetical protein
MQSVYITTDVVSSKLDQVQHYVIKISLKVALNTIKAKQNQFSEKNTPKTLLHAVE